MLTRYVTSFVSNLLTSSPRTYFATQTVLSNGSSFLRTLRKIEFRQLHETTATRQKKKKCESWFSRKKQPDGRKIIKPDYCSADSPKPIIDPTCKIAVVVGGTDGFGFAAADHLLCKGARAVIITDNDLVKGNIAARKLCDAYGKNRVQFVGCNVQCPCQFEAVLNLVRCKYKKINIVFNDLDNDWPLTANGVGIQENNTAKLIRVEMNILRKDNGGSGGAIVNCASIFGFMGWPEDPYPVYCKNEPMIEVVKDFVVPLSCYTTCDNIKDTEMDETGIRLVSLCSSTKHFGDVGLPDFPDSVPNKQMSEIPACVPTTKHQIGPALSYVLAWAENGSVWFVEPAISVHATPRTIHFPIKEGEKIDPNIYQTPVTPSCSVSAAPPCVEFSKIDRSKPCPKIKTTVCKPEAPQKK